MVTKKQMERLIRTKSKLEQQREPWMARWKDIAAHMSASYGDWGHSALDNKRLDSTKDIYDNTANEASNLMADGLMGSCFGRGLAWFSVCYQDEKLNENEWASKWIKEQEDKLYKQLNKSNFYDEARAFVRMGADMGTAVMFFEDDPVEETPCFKLLHLKDITLIENRFGECSGMFRDLWLTADDAKDKFGEDTLPASIKNCEDYTTKFKFHQYIGQAGLLDLDVDGEGEYISVYWCDSEPDKTVREERYKRKPFAAWRWNRDVEGSAYGTQSPGLMQLSNIKTANVLSKNLIQLSQLSATPPIKRTKGLLINFAPAGITDLEPGQDFIPVQVTGNLQFTEAERLAVRQSIRQAYYSDFFLMLSQNITRQKTATEVAALMNEQNNIMSAFFNRLATEFLEPVIRWAFVNEYEAGRFTEVAEGEEGEADDLLKVDFISPIFIMQKRSHMSDGVMGAMGQILQMGQVYPQIIDLIKFDEVGRAIAEGWNVSKLLLKSENDVAKIREARAQMQVAMQNQQMQIANAEANAKIYKDTSVAPQDGSPQQLMLGGAND